MMRYLLLLSLLAGCTDDEGTLYFASFAPELNLSSCPNSPDGFDPNLWVGDIVRIYEDGTAEGQWPSAKLTAQPEFAPFVTLTGERNGDDLHLTWDCNGAFNPTGVVNATYDSELDIYTGGHAFDGTGGGALLAPLYTSTVAIQGRVVDSSEGTPIGDATVIISIDHVTEVTTNEFGHFYLLSTTAPVPDDEVYNITINASGYRTLVIADAWGSRLKHARFELSR